MTLNLYWITTSLVSLFLFVSSYTYVFSTNTIEGIKALGFPDFFRIQLAILKCIAAVLLLAPNISPIFKHWSYTGTFLFLLTAVVSHIAHKDGLGILFMLFCLIVLTIASYYLYLKLY